MPQVANIPCPFLCHWYVIASSHHQSVRYYQLIFLANFRLGTRVVTIPFFAGDVFKNYFEKSYLLWLFFLIHCLLMAIFFRPRQHHASSLSSSGTGARKFFLSLSLIFTQIFTFIPFKPDDGPSKLWRYAVFFYAGI